MSGACVPADHGREEFWLGWVDGSCGGVGNDIPVVLWQAWGKGVVALVRFGGYGVNA